MPTVEFDDRGRRIYEPDGRVLAEYLIDRRHVTVIRGPIGSGTSSCSCMKIGMIAAEQKPLIGPGFHGKRVTRWGVVRNTYAELRDTTLATWQFWYPEELYGEIVRSRPMIHKMRWGDVECDVYFLALDNDDDVKKLRSFEFTGFWFNELEYIPKVLFDEAESRTGRFPPVSAGGPTWDGVLGDMNAPNEDHWLPLMTGESAYSDDVPEELRHHWPSDWGYHVQPPALEEIFGPDGKTIADYRVNPEAENLKWLKQGYYEEKRRGKSKQWIDSRLMNRITFVVEGDPVWKMFRRETHVSPKPLGFKPDYPVVVALDFGRRPCALVGQEIGGRLYVLKEFRMYGVGASTFAPWLKQRLAQHYPVARFQFTGDPKGADKGQADELTAYDVFEAHGMKVTPAPVKNNHIETRITAVEEAMNAMHMGLPRLVIDPMDCPTLVAACSGKYCLDLTDGEPKPMKRGANAKYSDIADCLQYMVLFFGNGEVIAPFGSSAHHAPARVSRVQRSLRRVRA